MGLFTRRVRCLQSLASGNVRILVILVAKERRVAISMREARVGVEPSLTLPFFFIIALHRVAFIVRRAISSRHLVVIKGRVTATECSRLLVLHGRLVLAEGAGLLVCVFVDFHRQVGAAATQMLLRFLDPGELGGRQVEVADDAIGELEGTVLMVLAILADELLGWHVTVVLEADVRVWMVVVRVVAHALQFRTSYLVPIGG